MYIRNFSPFTSSVQKIHSHKNQQNNMMASTMTIPHLTALPNFAGTMPPPFAGHIQGTMPGAMQSGYPGRVPVTMQGQMASGPPSNGTNTPSASISPPVQTMRVPVVPVGGGCYNDGMEVVWHGEFSRLFSSFYPPHVWYLSITNSAPPEKWKFCRDSAKVRFCCQDCGNGWTSMKGRVTFWFHLNMATNEGFVQFKLYGQVCKKCNSGKFEYVMWYPEEVSKVMCNLYNKVGQTYYGFMQPPIRIDRRPGRPRNQHNADLCQACRDGECDQGRPIKTLYNFIPPGINPPPQSNPPLPPPRSQVPPHSMAQVIHPNLNVVVPPPHTRHIVMQPGQPNTSSPSMTVPVVQPSSTGPQLITEPVKLTCGVQPILTYSIVTAPVHEASKLTPVSEPFKPGKTLVSTSSDGKAIPAHEVKLDKALNAKKTTTASVANKDTIPSKLATVEDAAEIEKKSDMTIKRQEIVPTIACASKSQHLPASSLTSATSAKESNISRAALPTSSCEKKAEKHSTYSTITNGYAAAASKVVPKTNMIQVNGVAAV